MVEAFERAGLVDKKTMRIFDQSCVMPRRAIKVRRQLGREARPGRRDLDE